MMIQIEFFTTLGCHLCEDAELLLQTPLNDGRIQIHSVDIAEGDNSDRLMEIYGLRIPVIKRLDTMDELGWPFDCEQL
ncbi:MAG: glutaredoxin family protein, partial [Gammaproteobacteria bacterium]